MSCTVYLVIKLSVGYISTPGALFHEGYKVLEISSINISGKTSPFTAYVCCKAYYLSHHGTSTHYAYRTQSNVSNADVTPGHEHIGNICAIETAIWHGIRVNRGKFSDRHPLGPRVFACIPWIRVMLIYTPCSGESSIFVRDWTGKVLLP